MLLPRSLNSFFFPLLMIPSCISCPLPSSCRRAAEQFRSAERSVAPLPLLPLQHSQWVRHDVQPHSIWSKLCMWECLFRVLLRFHEQKVDILRKFCFSDRGSKPGDLLCLFWDISGNGWTFSPQRWCWKRAGCSVLVAGICPDWSRTSGEPAAGWSRPASVAQTAKRSYWLW